jgi:ABC-2 type transport system permease protein
VVQPATPGIELPRERPTAHRVINAREITGALVRRDFISRYRRTALGLLWSLIPAVFTVVSFYFLFVVIAGKSPAPDIQRPDGTSVPAYVFMSTGVVAWTLFATAVTGSSRCVIAGQGMMKSLAFPKSTLPLTAVLSALIAFGFEFTVLMVLITLTVGVPSLEILWTPIILLVLLTFSYGLALLLSGATVFLRDLGEIVGLVMRLWILGTPVIYSLDIIADRETLVRLIELNPVTGVIVSFRNVVLLASPPNATLLLYSAVVSLVTLAVGWYFFHRWQRVFPELV